MRTLSGGVPEKRSRGSSDLFCSISSLVAQEIPPYMGVLIKVRTRYRGGKKIEQNFENPLEIPENIRII